MTPGALSRIASVATPSGVRLARQITSPATVMVGSPPPCRWYSTVRRTSTGRRGRYSVSMGRALVGVVVEGSGRAGDARCEVGAIVMRSPYAPTTDTDREQRSRGGGLEAVG
jgi:hypothetical protein